jgi:deazaflavin-dependent oxidoreductase (nitroreductase family)
VIDLTARPAPTRFGEHIARCGVHVMEAVNIPLFRISHGRCGGEVFGSPVILLTTTGRTTGRRFTKPLLALPDGTNWIVVGSRGGTAGHPQWYRNLVAYRDDPERLLPPVLEAKGRDPVAVDVEVLTGTARDQWWERLVAVYPRFAAYQSRTTRKIPVIRLSPHH